MEGEGRRKFCAMACLVGGLALSLSLLFLSLLHCTVPGMWMKQTVLHNGFKETLPFSPEKDVNCLVRVEVRIFCTWVFLGKEHRKLNDNGDAQRHGDRKNDVIIPYVLLYSTASIIQYSI